MGSVSARVPSKSKITPLTSPTGELYRRVRGSVEVWRCGRIALGRGENVRWRFPYPTRGIVTATRGFTSTPPNVHTSELPHLRTSTPPHLHTSIHPHCHTVSPS